jgi:uncharacterized protein YgbK (DUF1537 family)
MIYVIADDLTGATDTGVQFSMKNYSSSVLICQNNIFDKKLSNTEIDVLVIDTETREADCETTKNIIDSLLNNIKFKKNDIIYKKIDSTLRGNIGLEIDLIMKKLDIDFCLLTPSFPHNERITKNGKLIVENNLLGFTDYYEGDLNPEDASYIPNILKSQSKSNIEIIKIEDLKKSNYDLNHLISYNNKGRNIVVIDALTENDLKEIVINSQKINKRILFAGSAGLANHINLINNKKINAKKKKYKKAEKLFIVAASRRNITNLQIEDVKNKFDVFELKINLEEILKNSSSILKKDISKIKIAMNNYDKLIIRPDPAFNSQDKIEELILKFGINFRDVQIAIKKYLGRLIKSIFRDYSSIDLFLTGGDTAAGICSELGVESLYIVDELLTGIPLSLASTFNYGDLNIITKAGGFGTENSISKIIDKLR